MEGCTGEKDQLMRGEKCVAAGDGNSFCPKKKGFLVKWGL